MFVCPKFVCWSPNPQCNGMWKWGLEEVIRVRLDHKSGALMMELILLKKRKGYETSLSSMWECNEKGPAYKPGRGSSPRPESANILVLNFLDFRTARNQCLLIKQPSIWYFVIAAKLSQPRTGHISFSIFSWSKRSQTSLDLREGNIDLTSPCQLQPKMSF